MNRSRLLHSMRPVVSRKRGLRCHRIPAASGAALLQISVLMLCAMMIMMIGSQEVSAASWDPEQEISTDDAGTLRVKQEISTDEGTEEQWYPSIAVDNGHVYVAWEDEGDGDWDIYYTYFDGSDWQPEQEISTDDAAEDQRYPSIAAENGRVYVAWEDEGDGDWDIYYRYFDGSDWQPEQEISMDAGTEEQSYPSIAVDGGKVFAVWNDAGDGDRDIYYRHFDGTSWQNEVEISTDIGAEQQREPWIAVDGDEVHVVWLYWGAGDWDIYYRHFDGTSWQDEVEISTDAWGEDQYEPCVAVDGNEVHVAWIDLGDGDWDIYYRHFDGTSWQDEVEISTDAGTEVQDDPSIAAEGDQVHVVWQDAGDGDNDIYYRCFDGTNWQDEVEISLDIASEWQWEPSVAVEGNEIHIVWDNEDYFDGDSDIYCRMTIGENQEAPSIAVNGDEVHVVWIDAGDGDNDIYYRHFDGTSWQDEIEISTDIGIEHQHDPSIAVNGNEVHVVWTDVGDLDGDIYYRHFDGTSWQDEVEISTDEGPQVQLQPCIAVDGDEVHVVWLLEGAGDNDVYYRHFDGTSWQDEIEIGTDVGTEYQWEPTIAAEDGKVYVVWWEEDEVEGDYDIHYRHFDGMSWQDEVEISTDTVVEEQLSSSLAVDGNEVHVVWQGFSEGEDSSVYYRHFDGTSWQDEMEISADDETEDEFAPSIAAEDGKVYVAWVDSGDGDWDIYYRHFNGLYWQDEEEISTDVGSEHQYNPAIAVGNGIAHIVWQDAGDGDIYYRRGTEPPAPTFTISVEPSSRTIASGETATYTVTVTSVNSFAGDVDLSIAGLPSPATGAFGPSTVTVPIDGSATSNLTIENTDTIADDTYALTIMGDDSLHTVSGDASLVLNSLGTIGGTVWDQDLNPVNGALVELLDSQSTVVAHMNTSMDGEYEFTEVEPGDYSVRASKEGYESNESAVTLPPGGSETVNLQIAAEEVAVDDLGAYLWAILLIIIVVIVLVALALLLKRKKPKAKRVSSTEFDEPPS